MNQTHTIKIRRSKQCNNTFRANAEAIYNHAKTCARPSIFPRVRSELLEPIEKVVKKLEKAACD